MHEGSDKNIDKKRVILSGSQGSSSIMRGYLNRLKSIECPDSTYVPKTSPLVLDRAEGDLIWDIEGNEYIDLCAGFGSLPLGHNPAELKDIFREQIQSRPPIIQGLGDVYPSRAKIELLSLLREVLPPHLRLGVLALSGSQAIEIAIKTTLLKTSKAGFIVFQGGYHGLDFGALALTTREDFRRPFLRWIPNEGAHVMQLPFGCSKEELQEARKKLEDLGFGLAGVIVEPVQGRAGVIAPPNGWLTDLEMFCKQNQALLIFDEIFTGLGRTGKLTHADSVSCDLLCLGKALGSGFPISVCFGTEEVMNAWPQNAGEAIHTGTFFGHPYICRIAVAVLQSIHSQDLIQRSNSLGATFLQGLRTQFSNHPSIKEIRGRGLMLALDFHRPGMGAEVMDKLRERGMIALAAGSRGECLSFTPALTVKEEYLNKTLQELKVIL